MLSASLSGSGGRLRLSAFCGHMFAWPRCMLCGMPCAHAWWAGDSKAPREVAAKIITARRRMMARHWLRVGILVSSIRIGSHPGSTVAGGQRPYHHCQNIYGMVMLQERALPSGGPESGASDYHPVDARAFSANGRQPRSGLAVEAAECASLLACSQASLLLSALPIHASWFTRGCEL